MTLKKTLIAFGFISTLLGCYKQESRSSNTPLPEYLEGVYHPYRVETNGVSSYYFDSPMLLLFLSSYGQESANVFDYNGSGAVDASDFSATLSGFGSVYEPNYDLYSAQVYLQASSGWGLELDGWSVCFLKTTPWDENPPGSFIPDTLKSFFLEGILNEGGSVKIWYYRKQ